MMSEIDLNSSEQQRCFGHGTTQLESTCAFQEVNQYTVGLGSILALEVDLSERNTRQFDRGEFFV
tara:strand:+ start:697 stop:891 length:195 start_codon:yes stop_codon:yes gene_type:complete